MLGMYAFSREKENCKLTSKIRQLTDIMDNLLYIPQHYQVAQLRCVAYSVQVNFNHL